jgi:DNA-binding response OmpR family regulator
MSIALRHAGYKVSSVFDEEEALSLIDSSNGERPGFNLVIIDTEMPGAFGRRLADALKHSVPKIPSLMVSNFSDKAFFIDLVSHGHNEFIENICGKGEAAMRIWDISKYTGKRA